MKRAVVAAAVFVVVVGVAVCDDDDNDGHPRLASWNIRDYPESDAQEQAVFEELPRLNASVVALQEITDPARFREQARQRLGGNWRAEFTSDQKALHQVGVLYDDDVFDLGFVREHSEVVLYDGARPALEVGLWFDGDDADDDDLPLLLDVIVVHLKAGREHADMRRRQLAALAPITQRARARGHIVVVAGDFNAGTAADRSALAEFGSATDVAWRSAFLPCTGRWPTHEEGCVGAALDHVFACVDVEVDVKGPCAEGCDSDDACPAYPSDHCPVVVTLR